ncbi:hypothetical protein [Moraxella lacunata]
MFDYNLNDLKIKMALHKNNFKKITWYQSQILKTQWQNSPPLFMW